MTGEAFARQDGKHVLIIGNVRLRQSGAAQKQENDAPSGGHPASLAGKGLRPQVIFSTAVLAFRG